MRSRKTPAGWVKKKTVIGGKKGIARKNNEKGCTSNEINGKQRVKAERQK
jgi:hypothetical protein